MYTLLLTLALACPVEYDPGPFTTYTETRQAAERYDYALDFGGAVVGWWVSGLLFGE